MPILSSDQRITTISSPALWHTDLHPGNILLSPSPTDPTTIEGIIDWQSTKIAPLFLQSRFPDFMTPPKDYTLGPVLPVFPNFDELAPEHKEQAMRNREMGSISKYYEMSCLAHDKRVYNALTVDGRFYAPFTCINSRTHGLVQLRECLLALSSDWSLLDLEGKCPYQINRPQEHDKQKAEYTDMLYLRDLVTDQLMTDESGLVPHERWEVTKMVNRELFDTYIDTMSEEMGREEAARKWPFPAGL